MATFALHIDTNTLAAVAEPLWKRDGSAQGDVVDLDLAPLFDGRLDSIEAGILNELPNMFAVAGLGFDASGNLVVHFTHQHPWTSPNTFLETNTGVAGNPNATPPVPSDRADLGYTGRLVVIADLIGSQLDGSGNPLPRFRYFTASEPDTILNPTALVAPDGFVTAPLLWADGPFGGVGGPPSPMKANTFPYVLLADDGVRNRLGTVTGNRASPSNNGNVLGNYSPTNRTGWQRADAKLTDFESLQTSPVQWTGFDFVHQRQTVENHFTLHRDFVAAQPGGSWTINVALVVKHTNPRVGSGPPFIPLATDTFAQFAYRLPHAALDVSAIRGLPVTRPQVMMPGGSAGSVNIPLNVRDWDVSQGFDPQLSLPVHLSTQELLETVPNGAAARPTGFADVPGVVATPVAVNDLATGNGLPGSELDYDVTISIPAATPRGVYPVVFRMEDPEVAIQDLSSWYSQTGVVPDWATPPDPLTEPQYALRPRTYQATEIAVCPVITGITPQFVSGNGIACGSRWRFVPIPSLDDISALNPTYIWSFGSGAVPSTSTDRDPVVRFTEPGTHQITLHVLTAACSIPMFSTSYNVDDPIARPAFTTPPSGTLATRAAPHSIGRGSAVVVVPGTAIDTSFRNR
ncbi:MAG TPA: hypothetical protein VEI97_00365, partial [bacterium]|nr:hypothetical protein [bacterium]